MRMIKPAWFSPRRRNQRLRAAVIRGSSINLRLRSAKPQSDRGAGQRIGRHQRHEVDRLCCTTELAPHPQIAGTIALPDHARILRKSQMQSAAIASRVAGIDVGQAQRQDGKRLHDRHASAPSLKYGSLSVHVDAEPYHERLMVAVLLVINDAHRGQQQRRIKRGSRFDLVNRHRYH